MQNQNIARAFNWPMEQAAEQVRRESERFLAAGKPMLKRMCREYRQALERGVNDGENLRDAD